MVVKFFPSLETLIGASGSYLTFAALAACGTLLIVITVPETKGKTEEEIQQGFNKMISLDTEAGLSKDQDKKYVCADLIKPLIKDKQIEI